jgi:hypothetical protein
VFHPHLHVLAASGLVDRKNRFHLMPVERNAPLAELFRHRFIDTLLRERLISAKRARQLLGWKQQRLQPRCRGEARRLARCRGSQEARS